MKLRRLSLYSITLPALVLISLSNVVALADDSGKSRESAAASRKAGSQKRSDQSKPEPESESPDQIKQLSEKVERLQALIEQQQRALAALERRLEGREAKPEPAALDTRAAAKTVAATTETEPSAQPVVAAKSTEVVQAQSQPTATERPALLPGWDKGRAFLRSSDGSFETFIGGYGQLDFRGYQSGPVAPSNTFVVRRARLIVEGKVHRYYDFKIEGDFADTANTILRDLFVRVHRIEELQLSFGQFRVPYSQEEIRSDAVQDFVERSLVNNLAPSRSPGIQASGVFGKGVFEYQIGAFNGKGLLTPNNNDTPEGAIRLRFTPWRNGNGFWLKGLTFGGAYTQGRNMGGTGVRGLTESRSVQFYEPDRINGKVQRANGELTWMLGPAAIRAEYD